MKYYHLPVLSDEIVKFLNIGKNKNYIDCTLGLGGHSEEILKRNSPDGRLLAIDQDPEGLSVAKKRLKKYRNRIIFVCDNFRNLDKIVWDNDFRRVSGILLDLGLASWQISDAKKGLTFTGETNLDMRMSQNLKITASDILNNYSEKQLSNLFFNFGDVRGNRRIAEKIVKFRHNQKIIKNRDLIEIIGTNNPKILAPVFQALRIEVNSELENLQFVLPQTLKILEPTGKIVVISYHSGEDRIVKNFFRSKKGELEILTKKPITASPEEQHANPRSRSAKLRAAEKV